MLGFKSIFTVYATRCVSNNESLHNIKCFIKFAMTYLLRNCASHGVVTQTKKYQAPQRVSHKRQTEKCLVGSVTTNAASVNKIVQRSLYQLIPFHSTNFRQVFFTKKVVRWSIHCLPPHYPFSSTRKFAISLRQVRLI